jgi:hypothetical protein
MKKNVFITSAVLLLIALLIGSCASGGGSGGKKDEKAAPAVIWSCDFSDPASLANWVMVPEEYWDFKGTASLSLDDKTLGMPLLRMDVDFTKDAGSSWSEPKMRGTFNPPLEGVRTFYFDIYYNPSFSKGGLLKSKIIIFSGKTELANNMTDTIKTVEELPNGYVKGTVRLVARSSKPVDNMLLSIVGSMTNYKGPVFLGNMRWE